jgi:hypothetical protein
MKSLTLSFGLLGVLLVLDACVDAVELVRLPLERLVKKRILEHHRVAPN